MVCLPSGDVRVSSFPLQLRHIHLMEAEALRKALESIEVRESDVGSRLCEQHCWGRCCVVIP